jgi:hypothetical protein
MHLQPYIIQYPSTYPNCGASQGPIVANNNLVKGDFVDNREGGKHEARFSISTAEVVSLRLVSHPKEKATMNAQTRISGTTG